MVKHVNNLSDWVSGELALLRPFPGRLEFAVRLALICALTTLVAEIYQTPEPALTTYVAFFVMKPDRATSILISVVMLLLISIVIGLLILISMAVIDQPAWRVAGMALLSFALLFLASASKLKPISSIVALIAAYALDLLSNAQVGELATRALLYAWLFVGIPAGVAIVVNLLFGPPPRYLAEQALAHRLMVAANALRAPNAEARLALSEILSDGTGEISAWLRLAGAEKTSSTDDIAALRQAAVSIVPIMLLVDLAVRSPEGALPSSCNRKIAEVLDEMASILRDGKYPIDISIRGGDTGVPLPPSAAAIWAEMNEALSRFAEAPLPDLPPRSPEKAEQGFFLPDAFTNPEHVQYALKATAAAMFCYVAFSLLDWPGIHTSLITCYIVSLGTTAETVEKLTLRILGCMLGAAAGIAAIIFLIPDLTSIGALMAVAFMGALTSGWIAGGSPRISYVGFQMAFAFFLCVIQGSAPAFDMTTARDRVIGILLGNLVVYLVFANIWPVTVARRIDAGVATLLKRLGAMMMAANRAQRSSFASEASSSLGAIVRDLMLARYEPAAVRPASDWLKARHRTAEVIARLMGALLLRANQDTPLRGELSLQLNELAKEFGGRLEQRERTREEPRILNSVARAPDVLDEQLVEHLLRLERASTLQSGGEGVAAHASA